MARCRVQNVDAKAFDKWFETIGTSSKDFETRIVCNGAVNNIRQRGYISLLAYKVMLAEFQLPEGSFIPAEEEADNKVVAAETTSNEALELLRNINNNLIELISMFK